MPRKPEYVTLKEFNKFKKELEKNAKVTGKCLNRLLKKLDSFSNKPEKVGKKAKIK